MRRLLSSLTSRSLVKSILKAIAADGVFILPNRLDKTLCDAIDAEFDILMNADFDGVATHAERENLLARRVAHEIISGDRFPALRRFVETSGFEQAAQRYFRGEANYPQKLYCVRSTFAADQKDALPYIPHTDKLHMFKYILYLSDVESLEDGPLHVARGQHPVHRGKRLAWLAAGNHYADRDNIVDANVDMTPVLGPRGTVVVLDTDTPHHAGFVEPGRMRKVVRIDITGPD